MDITILVERNGLRVRELTQSMGETRIHGVHRTRWIGAKTKSHTGYYSLVHAYTGRALNKFPMTWDESERLIDILIEDDTVQWPMIVDGQTAVEYYAGKLSPEAASLAGAEDH